MNSFLYSGLEERVQRKRKRDGVNEMRAGGVRKENESTMTVEKFYKIMEEKHEDSKPRKP